MSVGLSLSVFSHSDLVEWNRACPKHDLEIVVVGIVSSFFCSIEFYIRTKNKSTQTQYIGKYFRWLEVMTCCWSSKNKKIVWHTSSLWCEIFTLYGGGKWFNFSSGYTNMPNNIRKPFSLLFVFCVCVSVCAPLCWYYMAAIVCRCFNACHHRHL